jgi:hypothetical protein
VAHRYRDWQEIVGHNGSEKAASVEQLARGYRVPTEILEYASTLLPAIALTASAARDVADTLAEQTGTIGVIAAGSASARSATSSTRRASTAGRARTP